MLHSKAQAQLERLVEAFKSGEIGEVVRRTVIPAADVPCSKWSLCNRVIVSLAGTDDARGYRQWQEVGRHVKKGAKALYILVPWIVKKKDDEEDDEGTKVLRGFLGKAVFRYEDTEGEPIERSEVDPPTYPPLYEVAERLGLKVKYQGHQGDAFGYFAPGRKQIVLETHDQKTFWHELGHAAHERVKGQLKGGQDPKEEAVAELTATVIAGLYGSDWSGNCWRYLEEYSQNPLGLCLSVLSEVEQVLAEIFDLKSQEETRSVAVANA
jgi:hypothetical protein